MPSAPALDRDQALCRLAHRYFRSRGPAQLQDLAWWAGLTLAEAARGAAGAAETREDGPAAGTEEPGSGELALAGGTAAPVGLASELIDGRRYWFDPSSRPRSARGAAHLLPNFDELTVGYRDRSALDHPGGRFDPSLFAFGSVLSNVLVMGAGSAAPGAGC